MVEIDVGVVLEVEAEAEADAVVVSVAVVDIGDDEAIVKPLKLLTCNSEIRKRSDVSNSGGMIQLS